MAELGEAEAILVESKRAAPWPALRPWPRTGSPLRYPFDELPSLMREAIEEHRQSAQQPIELLACSALAAASLAGQHIADVRRDAALVGPISIFTLIIAESGERKSTADKALGASALRSAVDELVEDLRPELTERAAQRAAWEEEVAGVRAAMKRAAGAKTPKDRARLSELSERLEELNGNEPHPPIWPRLFFEDETSEALKENMALGWPSGGLWSDEAGVVVGSRGMSDDTALGMFGLLNRLWDGGELQTGRRTVASYRASGRRFTACLMMQSAVFNRLMTVGGGTARASGTLARFLVARPTSTAGTRLYVVPRSQEAGGRWAARLCQLAKVSLPTTAGDKALDPPELQLDPAAFEVWREFFDRVEAEQAEGREFAELRDVGAKAPENAARIAALFHLVNRGPPGLEAAIDAATMESAARVAGWHLYEARRVLGETDTEEAVLDAKAVVRCCLNAETRTRKVIAQNVGRRRLRGAAGRRLRDEAIELAIDYGWLRELDGALDVHPDAARRLDDAN